MIGSEAQGKLKNQIDRQEKREEQRKRDREINKARLLGRTIKYKRDE